MTHADPVDFEDMQALLRFGHGHLPQSRFLLLTVTQHTAAGRWLEKLPVTSAATRSQPPDHAVQIAFTPAGLNQLGLEPRILEQFADAFLSGMSGDDSRSRRLGDIAHNAPEHWQWGHRDRERLHALLLLYTRNDRIDGLSNRILTSDFELGFDILHELPTNLLEATEPFGFVDGISQPKIDWLQTQRTDIHAREAWSNLLAPGEVVLGYHDEYGQSGRRPLLRTDGDDHAILLPTAADSREQHDLGINGSYLVLRQLEQDVEGFWQFVHAQSGGDEDAADQLAALMVGRHRDGTPLMPSGNRSIPGIAAGSKINAFDYDADADGLQCPNGSHVRRSNPRTGDFPPGTHSLWIRLWRMLGFRRRHLKEDLIASTRFHRLLRRGRTYGPPIHSGKNGTATDPRGLQFISVGSNLVRQFEFVQSAWAVSSAFGGTRGQRDPLIGHRQPRLDGSSTADFIIPSPNGAPRTVCKLPNFVTVRGGAYFFLPGIRAIRYLAGHAQQSRQAGPDAAGSGERP